MTLDNVLLSVKYAGLELVPFAGGVGCIVVKSSATQSFRFMVQGFNPRTAFQIEPQMQRTTLFLHLGSGSMDDWGTSKHYSFVDADESAILEVYGNDNSDTSSGCQWSGLAVHCVSDRLEESPWHNFVSDITHW